MRPAIVGLNNPHSTEASKALGLEPVNGSGYRLWLMLKEAANRRGKDFKEEDYLHSFDRMNILNSQSFVEEEALKRREHMVKVLQGRTAVLCGTRVPKLLGVRYEGFHLQAQAGPGFIYFVIPHPSGLTREYNDPKNRERVGDLLFQVYRNTL